MPLTEPSDASKRAVDAALEHAGLLNLKFVSKPLPSPFDKKKIVAENRRARFDYAIEDEYEAGIALVGTEVKSLALRRGLDRRKLCEVKDEEVWLINANIPEFSHGNRLNHEPSGRANCCSTSARSPNCTARSRAGHDPCPALHLFQQPRPGEGRDRARQGQEGARQARYDEGEDWKREQGRLLRPRG